MGRPDTTDDNFFLYKKEVAAIEASGTTITGLALVARLHEEKRVAPYGSF